MVSDPDGCGDAALAPRDAATLAAFAESFRAAHHDAALGPIADAVLLDNERVRIWQMTLAPGAASALHRHDLDYVIVLLAGDRIAAVPGPDSTCAAREASVTPGRAIFLAAGATEWAVNTGARQYRELVIELKTPR
jgi:beta-alanine degradation protein BauB